MTIEAFLTRELDIRFIDARNIATEAKINLGIHGYPNQAQLQALKDEACRIFGSQSEQQRRAMQQMNEELESVKIPCGSSSSLRSTSRRQDSISIGSDHSSSSCVSSCLDNSGRSVKRHILCPTIRR